MMTSATSFLFYLCFPFLISYLGLFVVRQKSLQYGIVDKPNQRSSHNQTKPRGGGIAFVGTFVLCIVIFLLIDTYHTKIYWGLLINSMAIAGLGFIDDLYTLPRKPRLIAWVAITITSLAFGIQLQSITLPVIGVVHFGILSPIITFVWLIGVTNFFNFMDGIDGLAGGESLIVAGFMAVIALLYGDNFIFIASIIIFGSVLGFLFHNFPPAKIFMGDGGSNFLGYTFAALAIIGSRSHAFPIPFLIPVILLSLFLFDATVTLLKRIPKGKNWLEPHRDHYYQRLIIFGYTHKQITLLYSFISLALGLIALFYTQAAGYQALVLLCLPLVLFLIIVITTNILEAKKTKSDLSSTTKNSSPKPPTPSSSHHNSAV